jgi:hypothetical protein
MNNILHFILINLFVSIIIGIIAKTQKRNPYLWGVIYLIIITLFLVIISFVIKVNLIY